MLLVDFAKLLLLLAASIACVCAITDAEYDAVKNTLLKEMSNHHDFTTEQLFHDLATDLGLASAAQSLYPGSPTAKDGYKAIYKRLCQLSKDKSATEEQKSTIVKLEAFMKNIGLVG